ncbi:hypothetical protein MKZ38_010050 [Zalerion maritima]|uniref:Haloacid dehalogenase-like hydrolase n=1 Tax=Zalerion maritima TaxID=339359 RepID=A0AAD5WLY0_9PEZI|nr:hypothetical protein MKZ38_010050 [Zalerion maritima]
MFPNTLFDPRFPRIRNFLNPLNLLTTMAFVVDFDGTVTTKDTIYELGKYASIIQRERDRGDFEFSWEEIVSAYGTDYRAYVEAYVPCESERTSYAQEVEFLRGLSHVDARSRQRVEDLGLFAGVGDLVLRDATSPFTRSTKPVGIRRGFKEFVAAAKQAGIAVAVVSVNWSTAFIQAAIQDLDIEVIANRVTEDGKILGPPGILEDGRVISTSHDKRMALESITAGRLDTPRRSLLYVGDSLTDLECLCSCPGVVMAEESNSSLLRALSRVGKRVGPIGESGAWDKDNASLHWARDFLELLDSSLVQSLLLHEKAASTSV